MDRNSFGSSGDISSAPNHHDDKVLKDTPLHRFGKVRDAKSNSLGSNANPTSRDAQAGVKNIEAVSMTWTKWGLIAAYFGYGKYHSVTGERG